MKKSLSLFVIAAVVLSVSNTSWGQRKKKSNPALESTRSYSFSKSNPSDSALRQQLSQALAMSKSGQYHAAASALFNLARKPELENDRPQIKYILGLMLMELKLNQVAAFQFVDVIRLNQSKYTKLAIEKLSTVADMLGDDTLLNYAVSRVDVNDVPANSRDMIHFRVGEIQLKNKKFEAAVQSFAKVHWGSSYYNQALFQKGLAELEMNQVNSALKSFQQLLSVRAKVGVTDTNRVAAQLAMARTLYQKQEWDASIEAYAQIPRDHFLWHDALFEQSWAMMRAARFRSALSNFQSLHSTYYEDFFIPESLLLRAIVYLYICKYDEMEKVLNLFEKSYGPVKARLNSFLGSSRDATAYYVELEKSLALERGEEIKGSLRIPAMVLKTISDEGNVKRAVAYTRRLQDEKSRIEESSQMRNTGLGRFAIKVINGRIKNTKTSLGEMVKAHMQNMRLELKDLVEQASFIRYEMINGKKESLRKKIAGKILPTTLDEKIDRDFYVQNGYDYYPFQGEYWLDEIGNYHYLGQQSCE